jgi:hypothetical protein
MEIMATGYFDQFENFRPDHNAPLMDEFQRLAQTQQWKKGGERYRKERQACLTNEYHQYFGRDARKLEGWQALCKDLSIEPVPPSITKCKKVRPSHYTGVQLTFAGVIPHANKYC